MKPESAEESNSDSIPRRFQPLFAGYMLLVCSFVLGSGPAVFANAIYKAVMGMPQLHNVNSGDSAGIRFELGTLWTISALAFALYVASIVVAVQTTRQPRYPLASYLLLAIQFGLLVWTITVLGKPYSRFEGVL